ncbi:uncharacterized protein I206_104471 [Kwoniella pini CBS 10737]|uniref:MARVEL domain-containing protein n=1 Tax=Kwoniella pini CBS 10737 TaxID=1296096 RepID=A0A1B9I6W3_9TREE|nr:uncharacterized protein I206_02001 [Kwoniella pini CBS 10737]OCF51287.1 hypothetical protein I206_02001 [Kwoniella pini CBS 10737]
MPAVPSVSDALLTSDHTFVAMLSPLKLTLISNAVVGICGVVILGISAYVEHTTGKIGYHSSVYTYDAFVGAFTLVALVVIIALRYGKPSLATLLNEVVLSALLWIFYLAAGASTTHYTRDDRQVCKHIDDLFDLPEFENADQDAIAMLKKIFKSTCRDVKAQLAFIWIGFVALTITTIYLATLGMKERNSLWKSSLRTYDHDTHSHADPFADPVGSSRGPVAGVVNDDASFKP